MLGNSSDLVQQRYGAKEQRQGVAELKEQGIQALEKQNGLNNETILPKNRETRVLINLVTFV